MWVRNHATSDSRAASAATARRLRLGGVGRLGRLSWSCSRCRPRITVYRMSGARYCFVNTAALLIFCPFSSAPFVVTGSNLPSAETTRLMLVR